MRHLNLNPGACISPHGSFQLLGYGAAYLLPILNLIKKQVVRRFINHILLFFGCRAGAPIQRRAGNVGFGTKVFILTSFILFLSRYFGVGFERVIGNAYFFPWSMTMWLLLVYVSGCRNRNVEKPCP